MLNVFDSYSREASTAPLHERVWLNTRPLFRLQNGLPDGVESPLSIS